jgi:hypothetical protein
MLQAEWSWVRLSMGSFIFFSAPNFSSRTMAPGFIQPAKELSTGRFLGSKARPGCKAHNLTDIYEPIIWTMGYSTSHNPIGFNGLLQAELYFLCCIHCV